jgi:transposase-like protein
MGKQKTYSWGFKLQMVHLLGKGAHIVSQISRDYHVTRSLLYAWIWLYQERGEAAFVPSRATQYPPEIEWPQNGLEQVAYLERLCGQQALQLDLLRSEVDLLKKLGIGLATGSHPTATHSD